MNLVLRVASAGVWALILVALFAACGQSEDDPSESRAEKTSSKTPPPTAPVSDVSAGSSRPSETQSSLPQTREDLSSGLAAVGHRVPTEAAATSTGASKQAFDEQGPWESFPGCPRPSSLPAVLTSFPLGPELFLITANRLERFDLESATWRKEFVTLPRRTGPGLCAVAESGELVVVPGAKGSELWRFRLVDREVQRDDLPPCPDSIGVGAAIARRGEEIYLAPGKKSRAFWRLDLSKRKWTKLEDIASKVGIRGFGTHSGFLARVGNEIYGWPDHHIQQFFLKTQSWLPKTYTAMGFRPSLDGGALCVDPARGIVYSACGFHSRTLGSFTPKTKRNAYLRPRLPKALVGEGSRLALGTQGGIEKLWVYSAELKTDRLFAIDRSKLEVIDAASPAADLASAWRRVPTTSGGSGVRYLPELAKERKPGGLLRPTKARGSIGVMGALEDELFLIRLAQIRRIDPKTGHYTYYPGINLGRFVDSGACGVFDGKDSVYLMNGSSSDFLRWKLPSDPIRRRPPPGPRRPYDQTDLEVLPSTPDGIGRGAAMAIDKDAVYVLRAGGTRALFRFDLEKSSWSRLPSLPKEAAAPGLSASGLVRLGSALYAFPDKTVWRLDLETREWSRFATLPWAPHWNGGMVVADESDPSIFVLQGNISRKLGRLRLKSAEFEELGPRLPDVVSAKANRIAILGRGAQRRLYIHRGHNSNEIVSIAVEKLVPSRD